MDNKLMFFKVFLLPTSSQKLAIPLRFVSRIGGALPNKAMLRNRHGKLWPIKISKVENEFLFKEGWAKFVEDNSVEHEDFLTFRYDAGKIFDVKLYRRNECEKGLISPNSCVKREIKIEINDENLEETNDTYDNGRDYEEDKELRQCLVQGTCEKKRKRKGKEEIEKKINQGTKQRKGKKSANSSEISEIRPTNDHEAKNDAKYEKEFGDGDVFEYGIFSSPNTPYFVAKFRATRPNELLVPSAFSEQMKGAFPKQAFLRNQRGNVSSINITNNRNNFYFTNGWSKFVKNNNVEDGDFLMFSYDESRIFDVTIYGNSTCNKLVAENEERESEEETDEFDQSDETFKESNEYMDETDEEEFEMENNKKGKRKLVETFEGFEIGKEKGKGKIAKNDSKMLQMVVVNYDHDEQDFGNNGRAYKGFESDETSTKDYKRNKAANKGPKGKNEPKGKASEASDDEDEIFKHKIIARPKNPYFVTKLRPKRKNELYIPVDVIRDFNLEIPEKMIILDDENKEWNSNVKIWGDGRYWLTNGWKAFRKWNALTWHDRCLCEFIKESGPRGLFLKIRILREGSWLPKEDN